MQEAAGSRQPWTTVRASGMHSFTLWFPPMSTASSSTKDTNEEPPLYLSLEPSDDLDIGQEGARLDLGDFIGIPGAVTLSAVGAGAHSDY